MANYPEHQRFVVANEPPVDVVKIAARIRRGHARQLHAGRLAAGDGILRPGLPRRGRSASSTACRASSCPIETWAKKFTDAGIPCVGDDVKAQVGATITHRTLARLFNDRGVRIDSTYQLNTGGNTDFLNMLNRDRLASKKVSKTEAVQSQLDVPLDPEKIHIGPSDFVPFQKDNKVCFLRIEGTGFGGVPMNLELRLSVEDSPNSAGVVVDAIRCCKLARDAGLAGPLEAVSAWTMKHPPRQMHDGDALKAMEDFISSPTRRTKRVPSAV